MFLDILLVCYNQRPYIQQALESIFMQDIPAENVRLIIADDASTDGTDEIIRKCVDNSPFRVVLLPREKNLGISKNYLRGFSSCDADYIAILEGDDYWCSPNHLKQHVEFLEEHRECSMSMNCFISQEDRTGMFTMTNWGYDRFPHFINVQEQIEKGNKLGNLSACVLRSSCVKKLPKGLFDLSIADWMLGVMLSQQGYLAILENRTSVYRMNSGSSWASLSKAEQIKIMIDSANKYDEFQDGKYHEYWQNFISSLLQEKKGSWKKYCPPFMISFLKACTPPAFRRKVQK